MIRLCITWAVLIVKALSHRISILTVNIAAVNGIVMSLGALLNNECQKTSHVAIQNSTWTGLSSVFKLRCQYLYLTAGVTSWSLRVKVKFTLEQTMKAQRGSRVITLLFPLTLTLDGSGWSTPRPGCFTSGNDPVRIVQEAG